MKKTKQAQPKYRGFTGDTGHSLDWQIGFEDPMFLDFLGIGNATEQRRRAEVLNDIRTNYYPSPAACSTGSELLPMPVGGKWSANATWGKVACGSACQYVETKIGHLRQDIAEAQRKIDSGESKDVAPRYMEAFTTILGEYIDYYNRNCLSSVANTASDNSTPAPAPNPLSPSTNNLSSTPLTPGNAPASGTSKIWMVWAGLGVLALGAGVLIYKKFKK